MEEEEHKEDKGEGRPPGRGGDDPRGEATGAEGELPGEEEPLGGIGDQEEEAGSERLGGTGYQPEEPEETLTPSPQSQDEVALTLDAMSGPQVRQQIRSFLAKVQLQALQEAEKLMRTGQNLSLPQLISTVKDLAELEVLVTWIPKLEKIILKGKAPLLPPAAGKFPALSKLTKLGKSMSKAAGAETPDWAGDVPGE